MHGGTRFSHCCAVKDRHLCFALLPLVQRIRSARVTPFIRNRHVIGVLRNSPRLLPLTRRYHQPLTLLAVGGTIRHLPVRIVPSKVIRMRRVKSVGRGLQTRGRTHQRITRSLSQSTTHCLRGLRSAVTRVSGSPAGSSLCVDRTALRSGNVAFWANGRVGVVGCQRHVLRIPRLVSRFAPTRCHQCLRVSLLGSQKVLDHPALHDGLLALLLSRHASLSVRQRRAVRRTLGRVSLALPFVLPNRGHSQVGLGAKLGLLGR